MKIQNSSATLYVLGQGGRHGNGIKCLPLWEANIEELKMLKLVVHTLVTSHNEYDERVLLIEQPAIRYLYIGNFA